MKKYKTGTLVKVDGQDAILAQVDYGMICLIDLTSGNRWASPVSVDCADEIPLSAIKKAADGEDFKIIMERTYD